MKSNKVDRALNLASVHGKIFHIKQRILIVQPNQFCLQASLQCQFSPNERQPLKNHHCYQLLGKYCKIWISEASMKGTRLHLSLLCFNPTLVITVFTTGQLLSALKDARMILIALARKYVSMVSARKGV